MVDFGAATEQKAVDIAVVVVAPPFSCVKCCREGMRKVCELCEESATVRCNADEADLCWKCDAYVHGGNDLLARHMRLILCSCCCAETECQTSGASPCPLSRRCAACDPAHVDEEAATVRGSAVLSECIDDSKELPTAAAWLPVGAKTKSCGSQESLNDAHSSVEDEKAPRNSSSDSSKGRPKRLRGGRAPLPGQSRKQASARKSRKKGESRSPAGAISVDTLGSNGSLVSDISLEAGLKR